LRFHPTAPAKLACCPESVTLNRTSASVSVASLPTLANLAFDHAREAGFGIARDHKAKRQ
jgi:hypothetical protein